MGKEAQILRQGRICPSWECYPNSLHPGSIARKARVKFWGSRFWVVIWELSVASLNSANSLKKLRIKSTIEGTSAQLTVEITENISKARRFGAALTVYVAAQLSGVRHCRI